MSLPLPAMVARVWTKRAARARDGLAPAHDPVDLDLAQLPALSLQVDGRTAGGPERTAEAREPIADAPAPTSEQSQSAAAPAESASVQSPAAAEQLVLGLTHVMNELIAVVEEETRLVRAGDVEIPMRVEQSKADLAQRYSADICKLQCCRPYLRQTLPLSFAILHQRHETFRALLHVHLTLLAAERAAAQASLDASAAAVPRNAAPHRPRPRRLHLPRLAQARGCPLPRQLQQPPQARTQPLTPSSSSEE